MKLCPVPYLESPLQSLSVTEFQAFTAGRLSIIFSTNSMSYGEEKYLSISADCKYPTPDEVAELVLHFFGLDSGTLDIYHKHSAFPPPKFFVHVFGKCKPLEEKGDVEMRRR